MLSIETRFEIGNRKLSTSGHLRIISVRELWNLRKELERTGVRPQEILDVYGFPALEDITVDAYEDILEELTHYG